MIPPSVQAALQATRQGLGAGPSGNIADMVTGPLDSAVAGRTDHLPVSVPPDSYVIPADVVSALGEGNTAAGFKVLQSVLRTMTLQHLQSGAGAMPQPPGKVDVMVAGGEFVVPPQIVVALGDGDMRQGRDTLHSFVVSVRRNNIAKLQALPGPKR